VTQPSRVIARHRRSAPRRSRKCYLTDRVGDVDAGAESLSEKRSAFDTPTTDRRLSAAVQKMRPI